MTEEEWLNVVQPAYPMNMVRALSALFPASGSVDTYPERKVRLFGCAAVRRLWRLLVAEEHRNLVELAEWVADGKSHAMELLPWIERGVAVEDTLQGGEMYAASAAGWVCEPAIGDGIGFALEDLFDATVNDPDDLEEEHIHQKALLLDIFGNPFRPVAFDPRWRSESVVALARTAYDTRNFSLLPILADALEDAGCDSAEVLTHLRQPDAVHVRGCWAVDGVLGLM
jgi:hypothetical protein